MLRTPLSQDRQIVGKQAAGSLFSAPRSSSSSLSLLSRKSKQAGLQSSHDDVVKLLPPLCCRDTHKEVFVRVNFRPVGFS